MVIVALVVNELFKQLFIFIVKRSGNLPSVSTSRFSLNTALIEAVILLPWLLSFQHFNPNLQVLWQQITTRAGPDVLGEMRATLSKINVQGFDLVTLYLKLYGVTTIFLILSLIGIYFLITQIRSNNISRETPSLFSLTSVFLFFGFLYLLYLLGTPGLQAIGAQRILAYAMVFTSIFAGFTLYELFKRANLKHLASIGIICLIMVASTLSISTLYSSPFVINPNLHITQKDIIGMTWFIEEKDSSIGSVYVMTLPSRFADGILGRVETRKRADMWALHFPDHFAYDRYDTLGEQYTEDKYTAITKFDRILYVTVWKEVGRWSDSDFERLENDPSVDKLYSNNGLDVYYVHAID